MKWEEQRNAWTILNNFTILYITPGFPKWKYKKGRILSSTLTEIKISDRNAEYDF